LAFLLTAQWLAEDKINVQTSTCWIKEWLVSTGDLASGVWIFAIALHTFFAIIKGEKFSYPISLSATASLWLFIYAMAIAGVLSHRRGLYLRAVAWVCCGRDKSIPNGWSFNWESMATREMESLERRCVASLLVVYVCVLAISNRCQKTVPLPIRG
jgi:hypothetical protein